MFLSTLLSDAAAQHGHEFSAPRPNTPSRLSPIPRTIRPTSAKQRPERPSLTVLPRSAVKPASSPTVPKAEKVMFADETQVKIVSEPRLSMCSSSEEDVPNVPEPATQREEGMESKGVKRKRPARSKTTYNFAHPPPSSRMTKLKYRQRAVLQMHQVVSGSRPKPAYDVFPSSRCPAKLGRHLTRLHRGKDRLGPDDVVVSKAQAYDAKEDEERDPEDVIGIICSSCKSESHSSGNAQLCLEDGSMWEAIPHARGRYDFISTDEHGISRVVRWVPRRVRGRQRSSAANSPVGGPSAPQEELVYRFSTIDLRSRRHPVIANMTPTSLDINNVYYMPRQLGSVSADGQSTVSATPDQGEDDESTPRAGDRQPIKTTNLLHSFILLSGIYVALRNSWSPVFSLKSGSVSNNKSASRPGSRNGSIHSRGTSPTPSLKTPSLSGMPPPLTKRFTWSAHRRAASVAASPSSASAGDMFALRAGRWNESNGGSVDLNSSSYEDPSRSSTPDSRRRRRGSGLFRTVTDRWRQPSHSTVSSTTSTALNTPSEQSSISGVMSATPTPASTGLSAAASASGYDSAVTEMAPIRRAATISAGFMQRTSTLRRHFRYPSKDSVTSPVANLDGTTAAESPAQLTATETVTDTDGNANANTESKPRHSRTWSFARGRRREKSLSMAENRPATAINSQWWVDWGRSRSPERPITSIPVRNTEERVTMQEKSAAQNLALQQLEGNSAQNQAGDATAEQEKEKEKENIKPRRRSLSLRTWMRNPERERPKSVLGVFDNPAAQPRWGVPGWDASHAKQSVDWGQGIIEPPLLKVTTVEEKRGGFGQIMRRVTHRLRREERKIG